MQLGFAAFGSRVEEGPRTPRAAWGSHVEEHAHVPWLDLQPMFVRHVCQ